MRVAEGKAFTSLPFSLFAFAVVTPGSAGAMATANGGAPVGVASLTALRSTIVLLLLIGDGLQLTGASASPVGDDPPTTT